LGVGLPMRGMLLDAEELDLWFNLDDHFKEDLKGRVTRFLQSALLGRFVTLLREVEEAPFIDRIRTVLQITDDFSTVHLLVLKQAVGLPMANILDVLAMHGDGKDLFPAGLTANLKSSEHDRLLRIRASQGDKIVTVFLLEASKASRDELLSGLLSLKHVIDKRRAQEAARLREAAEEELTATPWAVAGPDTAW